MFPLLIIFISFVCHKSAGTYYVIDPIQAQSDQEIQALLDFSIQQIIHNSVKTYQLPNENFALIKVNKVLEQPLDSLDYKFEVELQDNQGSRASVTFFVEYEPDTGKKRLTMYDCRIIDENTGLPQKGYIDLDREFVLKSALIQGIMDFGTQQIIRKGIVDEKLPLSEFIVTNLTLIQKQDSWNKVNYKFNIALENDQGLRIQMEFVVSYQPLTNEMKLGSYNYRTDEWKKFTPQININEAQVPNGYEPLDVGIADTSSLIKSLLSFGINSILDVIMMAKQIYTKDFQTEGINYINRQVSSNLNHQFDIRLADGNGTFINTTFTIAYQPITWEMKMVSYTYNLRKKIIPNYGIYVKVDPLKVEQDNELAKSLNFGMMAVLQKGYDDNKIPVSSYSLTKIQDIQKQVFYEKENYKFTIELENIEGGLVRMNFEVACILLSEEIKLISYYYQFKQKGPSCK